MKLTKVLAVCLETVGCCIGIVGIAIEVVMGAEIGFILITGGAVIVAVGGIVFAKLTRKGEL